MIVDTSALIAILLEEEDADDYLLAIQRANGFRVSTASLVETTIVYMRRNPTGDPGIVRDVIRDLNGMPVPVTESIALETTAAYLRFGKGRHPAKLNYGDCFSYALAKSLDQPLLFKGNDFSQTDVKAAMSL